MQRTARKNDSRIQAHSAKNYEVKKMAGTRSIAQRRKLRELEAKRDKLLENAVRNKSDLAKVRAELGAFRKARG